MRRLLTVIADYIRECDKLLLSLCIVATLYGSLAVYSAGSTKQFFTHFISLILGVIIAIIISKFDYSIYKKIWPVAAIVGLVPVFLTFYIGFAPNGTDDKAWLMLPGNISFQPSEFLKIIFVITFSLHLNAVKENLNRISHIILLCLHGAFPVVLIHLQGDDGTAMVFLIMFIAMMFTAGLKIRYFVIAGSLVAVAVPVIYFYILNDDQKSRIMSLFNLEADLLGSGWQQWRGRVAFANGGLFGKGLFKGDLVQSGSIPEGYNDFIISSIGEELGFVGCMVAFLLLLGICLRILAVSHHARDLYGNCICVGVFSMLAAQIIINLGMCLSVLPVIGVTLPFFSAGGTSICCLFAGIGLVLSVYMNKTSRTLYLHDNY